MLFESCFSSFFNFACRYMLIWDLYLLTIYRSCVKQNDTVIFNTVNHFEQHRLLWKISIGRDSIREILLIISSLPINIILKNIKKYIFYSAPYIEIGIILIYFRWPWLNNYLGIRLVHLRIIAIYFCFVRYWLKITTTAGVSFYTVHVHFFTFLYSLVSEG